MAQGGSAHDGMDIQDQRDTFQGFLIASLWCGGLIIQSVALLTVAFAIGAGWWAGLSVLVGIGAAIGFAFRMSGVYWAVQVFLLWAPLAVGGLVAPALAGMMS